MWHIRDEALAAGQDKPSLLIFRLTGDRLVKMKAQYRTMESLSVGFLKRRVSVDLGAQLHSPLSTASCLHAQSHSKGHTQETPLLISLACTSTGLGADTGCYRSEWE